MSCPFLEFVNVDIEPGFHIYCKLLIAGVTEIFSYNNLRFINPEENSVYRFLSSFQHLKAHEENLEWLFTTSTFRAIASLFPDPRKIIYYISII